MTKMMLSALFVVSTLSAGVGAQTSHWMQDGCFYTWNGRQYTTELCRRPSGPYAFDYLNPVRREWLMRIDYNPANLFQDITLLQGPYNGWTARLGVAKPGEAVRAGIWAVKPPRGNWINTLPGDTAAGRAARDIGNAINGIGNGNTVAITLGARPRVY
jgi:hypothetical protein